MKIKDVGRRELPSLFAALLVGVSPVLFYHLLSQEYPSGDDAGYLRLPLSIYRKFITDGFLSGAKAVYALRDWKPILHPILALPAYFLTRGRVLPAQAMTMVGLYILFVSGAYALARAYLGKLDSVLAASLLAVIPWVSLRGHFLNSELPFVVFMLGSCAALLHSDYLSRKWPSVIAAVSLGLAICSRPIETILAAGILFSGFAGFMHRSGKLSVREIWGSALMLLPALLPIAPVLLLRERFPWSPSRVVSLLQVLSKRGSLFFSVFFIGLSHHSSPLVRRILSKSRGLGGPDLLHAGRPGAA